MTVKCSRERVGGWRVVHRFLVIAGGSALVFGAQVLLGGALSASAQAPDLERVQAGLDLWKREVCSGCHGTFAEGGSGGEAPAGPNLREADLGREEIVARITNGRGEMPSFAGVIEPEEIQVLVDYLMARVVGQGEVTYDDCVFNQGGDAAGCDYYPR